jgi:hypothetical protein
LDGSSRLSAEMEWGRKRERGRIAARWGGPERYRSRCECGLSLLLGLERVWCREGGELVVSLGHGRLHLFAVTGAPASVGSEVVVGRTVEVPRR